MLFIGTYNLYEEHCPLKYFKLFFAIYRIQNVLDFAIIKNINLLMDIGSIKFFHNGLIQQPWRLNLGSLHPVAATASPFFYCTYLTCLILYSGRAQEHLSVLSDRNIFCSVVPHLLHWKRSISDINIPENRSSLQVAPWT